MKKLLASLFFVFFLVSCGSNTEDKTTNLQAFEGEDFTMMVPINWVNLTEKEETLPNPSFGEVALAFASTDFQDGFSNNMLIIKDILNYETTSAEFSSLNNIGATGEYLEYEKIGEKEISFADDESSLLYTFVARYNEQSPKLTFLQTAHICEGKKSFFLTIALPMNITDATRYEEIITSFACK